MNAGLIASYVIAGIILLSMLMMNMRVSNSSVELTLTQLTREKTSTVTDMIYDDFPNMGYNLTNTTNSILTIADSNRIQFYRKLDKFSAGNPELITWELTNEPVTETQNPNDVILRRTVEVNSTTEVTDINLGVTRFRIWYFDEFGLSTLPEDGEFLPTPVGAAKRDSVRQIYIALELQSPEPLNIGFTGNSRYIRSGWEKRFSPGNLAN